MAGLEGYKQFHDSLKQLTTLSTGAIGLVIIFVEKIFPTPEWKWAVVLTLILLVASLFCSVTGMFLQSLETMNKENIGDDYRDDRWGRIGNFMALSYYLFFGAVLFIGIFFAKNYY
ncbi:MAG: hypothetical protein ABIS30_00330 [Gallionella sp.]|jgi:hypothetical protein